MDLVFHIKFCFINLNIISSPRNGHICSQSLHYDWRQHQFTSREKLNNELGWETIQQHADILSLNIFHKIHLHLTKPLIPNCMQKLDTENECNIRSKGGYCILWKILRPRKCACCCSWFVWSRRWIKIRENKANVKFSVIPFY